MIATDLKNGVGFLYDAKPYKVIKYQFIKVGRGGALVRVTAKNLISGSTEEKTFNSTNKIEEISTLKRKLSYLYKNSQFAVFMDPATFEQIEIPIAILGSDINYVKEGEAVDILFWMSDDTQGKADTPLSVDIPPKVTLTIKETTPGVKGNSASNVYKQAILENGLSVKVPLFINEGDKVRVDTRTGDYVERAK